MKPMRYISLIIALLSVLGLAAQQQQSQYALYNYRNDGDFNAWLNIDVDSITYSNIGLDSVEYDNIVTQEVWTPDSCYRIPIEVIDSIGFRAPKPILQDGLFYLRDYHAALTNSVDSLTIYFDDAIRLDSLPAIGQVVLSASYSSPYEGGFAGRVKSIERNDTSVVMECEMIAVADVYKRLVLVGKAITDSEGVASSRRRASGDAWVDFEDQDIKVIDNIGDLTFSCLNDMLTVQSKEPTAVVNYYVYIDELFYSMYAQMNLIHHDLQIHVNMSLAKIESLTDETKDILKALRSVENLDSWLEGKLNGNEDKKDEPGEIDLLNYFWKNHSIKNKLPIPIAGPLVLDYEFAPVLKLKGDIELDWAFKTKALNTFYVKASGYTAATLTNPQFALLTGLAKVEGHSSFSSDPITNQQIDFRAKGSLTTGISGKVTISLINKNVVHATVSAQTGFKTSGQLNLKLMDTSTDDADETIYEATKDTKVKTEFFAKAGVNLGATPAKLLSIGEEWEIYTKDLGTTYLFPHFTQPALPTYDSQKDQWSNGNSNSHLALLSEPSKNIPDILLGPCKIGLKIVNEDGFCVKWTEEREYRDDGTIVWGLFPLSIDLTGLTPGKTYRCFPVLRYHDWQQLRATPSYEFTMPENLSVSPESLSMPVGMEYIIEIRDGWDTFAVVMEEGEDVVSILHDEETDARHIKVIGNKEGTALLKIEDRRSGQVVRVPITISHVMTLVTGITLSEATLNMKPNDTKTLTATVMPEDAENKTVAWESSNEAVATVSTDGLVTAVAEGSCVITCSATDGSGVFAECQVTVTSGTTPDPGNHEWVDLGLPSGTKWATCNVGANSPEEYGDYFAWGETAPKDYYDWSTYFDSDYNKYNNNGGLTELLPEDDAATKNWGSPWHMPTFEQIEELLDNCTREWTTQGGVNGILVTGPNGSTIFLPAAGYRWHDELGYAGIFGEYWSSSLGPGYNAYVLVFDSGYWDWSHGSSGHRYLGQSVRAVRS